MIRIVIDTNVYVSALVFGGNPGLTLRLVEAKRIQLATTEAIRAELEEILTVKFGWASDRVRLACEVIWETAEWIRPGKIRGGSRDPGDDHVLACTGWLTGRAAT